MADYSGKYRGSTLTGPTLVTNAGSKAWNQFHGLTTCTSVVGGIACVISSQLVRSGCVVAHTLLPLTGTWSAQRAFTFGVRALVPGVSLTLGTVGSVAIVSSFGIAWEMAIPTA